MTRRAALRWCSLFLLLGLMILASHAATAQSDPLNQAFELLKGGRFSEAIPFAEQAVKSASGPQARARALVLLGNLRSILGQFEQSEPLYKRAIEQIGRAHV